MNAKEYLSQAYKLDKEINGMLEVVVSLRTISQKTTSILCEDVVSHTRNVCSTQEIVERIVDMETEINKKIDCLIDLKKEIFDVIMTVADRDERTILELRYLCYKGWEAIAEHMSCSESSVYKKHAHALSVIKIPDAT